MVSGIFFFFLFLWKMKVAQTGAVANKRNHTARGGRFSERQIRFGAIARGHRVLGRTTQKNKLNERVLQKTKV